MADAPISTANNILREQPEQKFLLYHWEFDITSTIHARPSVTDHGWKIAMDRGLDIFQHYEMNDAFTFANRL